MQRKPVQSFLSLVAIIVLVTLSACGGKPASQETAPQAVAARVVAAQSTVAPAAASSSASSAAAATRVQPAAAPTVAPRPLPPTVVSVKPDRGEEQFIAAPVIVTFDQPMDPASTSAAFSIEPKVSGEVKVDGNALTFTPTEKLERSREYRVTLAQTAASTTGLKLQRDVTFRFTTAGFLQVASTQPSSSAQNVTVDTPITVAFNRPVVPLVGTDDQASLPQPLVITPTVTGKGEWVNTSLYTFTPTNGLAASTAYTVTVKAGLEDTTGGMLSEPFTFTFRTTDPTITRWLPENTVNVRIERPISVTFSMPMDHPSAEAAFSLLDPDKKPVAGNFNWNETSTELGFKPAEALKFGARYTAAVAESAKAANGEGNLRDARTFAFQTVRLPIVIDTEPTNGSQGTQPDSGVRFVFASPINPASLVTGTVTVLPKPTRVMTYYNEYDGSLFVDFPKLPATDYTVTLSGKIADPYGNVLGEDFILKFRTGDLPALLQLNNQQQFGTYSAYTNTQAVVLYRNMSEVRFRLASVPVEDLVKLSGRNYWDAWNSYTPRRADVIREWARKTTAAANESGWLREPLADAQGNALKPGVYLLTLYGMSNAAYRDNPPKQLIVRTDLNVTLKAGSSDALAWVTDLKSGLPVEGVTVRFTDGKTDLSAVTDRDGVATVKYADNPRKPWDGFIAIAQGPNGQFGLASSNWTDGIGAWEYGLIGGVEQQPYQGYVYTDRPIYRPGQTVYWKAIIRSDDDARYSLPAPGQPVTVTINDDQGNLVVQQRQVLNPLGATDGSLELGPDASTGYYYLNVRLNEQQGFGISFQVAEYRKPEYEITVKTNKPEYAQGERIALTAEANYFFGGPVKNGKVHWLVTSTDEFFNYKGEGGYSFTDFDWWNQTRYGAFGGMITEGDGRTDANGQFTITVPADIAKFTNSQRFTFGVTVQDANNQEVYGTTSVLIHKGAFYIGLAPRSYVLQAGDKGQVDVLTVDPQSRPVAAQKVDLVVSRVEWRSVREQLEDGQFYWTTRAQKTGVVTQTVTTDANGAAVLNWTPKEPGEYKVEATGRDSMGNTIRSGASIWVSGDEYVAWRQENNDRIKLVADKDEYNVGDTAEVLIPSPYQGEVKALVTVERGRVLDHTVLDLTSNSQVLRLPIEDTFAPNVFVSVVIVKGIDERSPAPTFKMGLAQLKVSTSLKQLTVTVTPRTAGASSAATLTDTVTKTLTVLPRDKIVWDVVTTDANGKGVSADVSLALVDKAVLTLASDPAGSILDRFYSQRGLGVQTGVTLALNIDRLVSQLAEEGKGGGGGGDGGAGLTVRSEFPDIAFWRASVTTDEQGKATVEVTLPDNLTTWVMDARAVTEDTLVGQSETEIVATKPLLVRPVLPRFFVVGDKAEIAAIIHNTTQNDLEVNFGAAAKGLKLGSPDSGKATVPAGGTYKATWPVEALDDAARGEEIVVNLRADAPTARLSDAVQITLPVYRYSTPDVVGTAGQVDADAEALELVRLPENADPTRGELAVSIEPSLAAGMVGGLTYLEHYPYECVEQTMSRFLPNVVTFDALKTLGIARPDLDAKLPQQVGVGLQRIYARQNLDGGWGWWQADKSSAAVTAYIVFGLAKAQQADFTVDQQVLAAATKFLQRTLAAPKNLQQWQLNQQAFTLYALAEAGVKEPNRAGALFEERERLSHYAQAYLALALDLIGDDAAAGRVKTLVADLNAAAIVSATGAHWEEGSADPWNMNTDTRSTAIILDALTKLEGDAGTPLQANAVRWLMTARKADRWETTQENAWAIISLTDWMAKTGELKGNYNWSVALNGQALGSGTVTPDNVQDVTALAAGIEQLLTSGTNALTIARATGQGQTGAGQLYYTAHLKTYLPVADVQPLSRGFTVSRDYRLADCGNTDPESKCPTISQAKVGDVIEVTVNVVVPHTSHYVIVEDPIPAGTEIVNTNLRTTDQSIKGPDVQQAETNNKLGWWWTPTHIDLRDEKAVMFATTLEPGTYEFTYSIRASLPGAFLTLPVTAYQMYFPEVWGRGGGGKFVVTE